MTTKSRLLSTAIALVVSSAAFTSAHADGHGDTETKGPLLTAIEESKPIFNARLRYETVDQETTATRTEGVADALTYRFRAGLETGAAYDTKFLIEFDHVEDIIDDFNSTINGNTTFPVVADPNVTELNRLQLTNTSLPDTTTTLGRQRIILDDSRFVGNVGWRQNEQTFDGIRFQNTSLGKLVIDASYVQQVNRIFGDDSPSGNFEGDATFVNVSHPTPIGKVTGFAYLFDFDDSAGNSTQTLGVRLAGAQPVGSGKFTYAASYAQQEDYGSNPTSFDADYYLIEGAYSASGFTLGAGYEVLGSDDGMAAFGAPLGTLHKFQGWADKFLVTPAGGVEDLYAKAGYSLGDVGALKGVKFLGVYHDFSANEGPLDDYGSEINLSASAKWEKFGLLIKYADYSADDFADDTQKLWVQVDFGF